MHPSKGLKYPCATDEIRELMRTKDQWKKIAKKTNDSLAWSAYQNYCREVKREIRLAEREYAMEQIKNNRNNTNRPFAASGHMVQNPPCWRASYALGHPKQRKCKFALMKSLCSGCPSGQLALQHGASCKGPIVSGNQYDNGYLLCQQQTTEPWLMNSIRSLQALAKTLLKRQCDGG